MKFKFKVLFFVFELIKFKINSIVEKFVNIVFVLLVLIIEVVGIVDLGKILVIEFKVVLKEVIL